MTKEIEILTRNGGASVEEVEDSWARLDAKHAAASPECKAETGIDGCEVCGWVNKK